MPTTYDQLMSLRREGMRFSYTERDTMLYALSIGMARDPLDRAELRYVFEKADLQVVPTMASVTSRANLLLDAGLDRTRVVHGDQRLRLHRPMPPAADLVASASVTAVHDKGPDKGALIYVETTASDAATGEPLYSVEQGIFARGDGGVGGPGGARPPHEIPSRESDFIVVSDTRPDQALLYRLNGDLNPLHADPAFAAKAGFKAPILHGLCTYGIACRQVLAQVCGHDAGAIEEFNVRFTSPVYPGEAITTRIWVDGRTVSFRSTVEGRDKVVLDNGYCRLSSHQGDNP